MSRFRLFFVLSCALLTAALASGQAKRPMTIVELIDVPTLGSPRLSPDGSQILFTRTDTDWKKN
ncbi:MAG: hypothetical protein OXU35_00805, partial [Acidobacteriota bacterium]|nr:hypothetical protein [Acidobacteriota bacterium]